MCRSLTTAVLSLCFPEWFFFWGFIAAVGTYQLVPYYESGGALRGKMFLSKGNTEAWTRRSVGMSTMPPVAFVPLYDVRLSAGT